MVAWMSSSLVTALLLGSSLRESQAWTPSTFVSQMPVAIGRGSTSVATRTARRSQLSMAQVPIVNEWKVDRIGCVVGVVKNHPEIEDGDIITTSPLANVDAAKANAIVQTESGSKYRLGNPLVPAKPKPKTKNGEVMTATKRPEPMKNIMSKLEVPKAAPKSTKETVEVDDEQSLQAALQKAKKEYGLTGETVGDGEYLLAGKPQRSTSGKSNIWTAYRADKNGLPTGVPLTIKISTNSEALKRECENYRKVTNGLSRGMFVKFVDFLPVAGSSKRLASSSALVIERGSQDLKALLGRTGGSLEGRTLRDAAAAAAQCLQGVHASGLVWTDLKTENFVVVNEDAQGHMTFKGIDLESAMPVKRNPVDYSPEACPPEFAEAFLSGDGANFVLQFSYDVWSYGMLLYELSTGRGFFGNKNPSQITKMLRVPGYELNVDDVPDPKLRDMISQCLQTNPNRRPSITQLLLHPYFLTTGIGPYSF